MSWRTACTIGQVTMSEENTSIKNNSEKRGGTFMTGLAVGLAGLVILAGAGWFVLSKGHVQAEGPAAVAAAPSAKEIMHLDGFVVNLADTSGECFLRISIDLGLGHAAAGHGEKEGGGLPVARVRDVILRVLTTYRSEDLLAPEGKMKLKQELVKALQQAVPELDIRDVYFTDFLVQR